MFSGKTIVILLSLFALIAGQQNGTEDDYLNEIYFDENITLSSVANFQSDSLHFNDTTDVSETSETSLQNSTETVELLEPTLSANNASTTESIELYTVDTDETTTTLDDYIANANNSDDGKIFTNNTKFSCYGRQFGQYADVEKDCRVFHMCYPFNDSRSGRVLFQRITFLCDFDSLFDQQNLVCVPNSTLTHECIDSVKYYQQSNRDFLTGILNHLQAFVSSSPDNEAIDDTKDATNKPYSRLWKWN